MKSYHEFDYGKLNSEKRVTAKGKRADKLTRVPDCILTFDTETTSAFFVDGKWQAYNYSINNEEYDSHNMLSWVYIWQFGYKDTVYYGRSIEEFKEFVDSMLEFIKGDLVIYIHNLPFEFQFFRNVFTEMQVFARKNRHPMKCTYTSEKGFKVEFRCSLALSNQSLENIGKHNITRKKLVGDLDYNVMRFYETELSEKELGYCENDCLVLYEYLESIRIEYGNILNIPMTQTGKVRKAMLSFFKNKDEYKHYNFYCRNLVPALEEYKILNEAFAGGYVHANPLHVGKILSNVKSRDFTSAYPSVMITEKYPTTHFFKMRNTDFTKLKENELWIARITFVNIQSITPFDYIQESKIYKYSNVLAENGRVASADKLSILITNVDFEIIEQGYIWESKKVDELWVADSDYMNDTYREFVLKLYNDKTVYKDIEDMQDVYMRSKEQLNSTYGCLVTNYVSDSVGFDDNSWNCEKLTDDLAKSQLENLRDNNKLLTIYSHGIFVTAYNRRNLFKALFEIGDNAIYCDTDSVKYIEDYDGQYEELFTKLNNEIIEKMNEAVKSLDDVCIKPKDKKGKEHQLGIFDIEPTYYQFKTMGCKKYAYKYSKEDSVHITLAGVSKSKYLEKENVKYNNLHKLEDFDNGLIFDEHCSGRLTSYYLDEQQPTYIDEQHLIDYKYGLALKPTTYELSQTNDYLLFLSLCQFEYEHGYYLQGNYYRFSDKLKSEKKEKENEYYS